MQQQEYWDIAELECYLIDQFDLAFKSQTSYYSLLKEAKISWQKAQPKNPLQDPELVKKKEPRNPRYYNRVITRNKS